MAINNDWSLGLSGNPQAVADKTAALQASAGALRRLIPKAPPVPYPPKPPFEMPKYSKEVLLGPWVRKFAEEEVLGTVKSMGDKINSFKNDLDYIYPNPYERLVNEAVNRHISRVKKLGGQ